MPLLDTVIKMQGQGIADKDIAKRLREQGYSPKEILEAISQSKIKVAVSGQAPVQQVQQSYQEQYPQQVQQVPTQQYPDQYAYQAYPQAPQDNETAREIAEEVAEEKVSELREQVLSFSSLKKQFESQIQDLDKRLRLIESSIDKIQMAILGKIAEYSKDLQNITTELQSTQETFKKVINPTIDKVREVRETKEKKKK